MSGKFKTFDGTTLVVGHPPGPDTSHVVTANPAVSLNGKKAKITDLKADDNLSFTGDPVSTIDATR